MKIKIKKFCYLILILVFLSRSFLCEAARSPLKESVVQLYPTDIFDLTSYMNLQITPAEAASQARRVIAIQEKERRLAEEVARREPAEDSISSDSD